VATNKKGRVPRKRAALKTDGTDRAIPRTHAVLLDRTWQRVRIHSERYRNDPTIANVGIGLRHVAGPQL